MWKLRLWDSLIFFLPSIPFPMPSPNALPCHQALLWLGAFFNTITESFPLPYSVKKLSTVFLSSSTPSHGGFQSRQPMTLDCFRSSANSKHFTFIRRCKGKSEKLGRETSPFLMYLRKECHLFCTKQPKNCPLPHPKNVPTANFFSI